MWGVISSVFIVLYCLMGYYIGRRGWTTFGGLVPKPCQKAYWVLFAAVFFLFPAAEFGEDLLPPASALWLTTIGGYSMVAVIYICFALLILDFIRLTNRRLGFIPAAIRDHDKTPPVLGTMVLLAVIATVVYGGWNARHPVVTKYELAINKKAGSLKQLRIAMVSDIHYGPIIDAQRLKAMVDDIKQLKPDVIMFVGDITEGTLEPKKINALTKILSQMDAKYGKYAVSGNHDRELRGDSELTRAFQTAGVKVLGDSFENVADSFYVLGRGNAGHGNEQGRQALDAVMNGINKSLPIVELDHQPIDLADAEANGVDLQLSGHTHMGQVFPNHLITEQIYELDWGLLTRGNYHLIVSSGYGTWGPPLRIGNHSEIVLATLKFQ